MASTTQHTLICKSVQLHYTLCAFACVDFAAADLCAKRSVLLCCAVQADLTAHSVLLRISLETIYTYIYIPTDVRPTDVRPALLLLKKKQSSIVCVQMQSIRFVHIVQVNGSDEVEMSMVWFLVCGRHGWELVFPNNFCDRTEMSMKTSSCVRGW